MQETNAPYAYAFYAAAIAILITSIAVRSATGLVVSAFFLTFGAIYLNASHIINNLLLKHSLIIEVCNGYKLNAELKAATMKGRKVYRSVSAGLLTFGEKIDGSALDSIIASATFPFEYTLKVRQIDTRRFCEALETRKRLKEIAITKTDPKRYDKLNELRREIDIIDKELKTVADSKPVEVLALIKSVAEGDTETLASRESLANLEKLACAFSSAAGMGYDILVGEELLRAIEV